MIDILTEAENSDLGKLLDCIEENYEVENPTQMREEVKEFLQILQAEGMLSNVLNGDK